MIFLNNHVTYHLHTELSLLDSCTNFKLYVDKAKELGQSAICFTEHGNIFNWVDKKMYCEKNDIKYLHGVEIYLTEALEPKVRDNYHTILIAKNYEGFKELNTLVDLSTQKDHFYYKNRITFEEFLSISKNVIKISACLASPLSRLSQEHELYELLALKYDYYEIQPHVNSKDQKEYNKFLYELSNKYNKPLIAGTDTHSINHYKAECRSVLQKAKKIDYESEDAYDLTFKSYEELVDMFSQQGSLPEDVYLNAINNTNVMANSVDEFTLDLSFKYPKLYHNDDDVFKNLIKEKLAYKIKNKIIKAHHVQKYKLAIQEEHKVFKALDMVGFMLFMSELLTWCRENNIPYGYCRGSVGGSRIAYVLDIIDVDPEEWNTVFSRFCNISRKEIGDIDCDFSPSQRQLVYDYIIERFGESNTAYILAVGTCAEKGTIDEIGRALHNRWLDANTDGSVADIAKKEENSPYYIRKVDLIKKEYEDNPEQTKLKYPDLFYYFEGVLNTTVSQSMHPAGIVASPISLTDNYGTVWRDGKRVLSINMEEVHEISLVKYDILGLKNIEIIKDVCELINQPYPLSHQLDWEDEEVWQDMIKSPVGIFQFEGDYAFKLLKDYVPTEINSMSMINASLRPSGESYRDRLVAREFNKNPSEQIDKLLEDNNGWLIFQEDTIKFLMEICDFEGSEADNVRRAIGRKDKERLDKALPKILEGYCSKSDKPREIAEQEALAFLKIIEDSSNYQFGYNHSTGYSMIGYTCAYYRYYHPVEFVTAYLNNAGNEDDIKNGTLLAQLKGVKINPIKFRYSKSKYTMDKENNAIYKGLSSVKFCSEEMSNQLYNLKDNKYEFFADLLKEIKAIAVDSRQLRILTMLNFFSEFGKSKKLLDIIAVFDKLYDRKTIKLSQISEFGVDESIIRKHANSFTEKTIKDIDTMAIIKEYESTAEDKSLNIKERINGELEYMGYVEFIYPTASKNIYFVSDFKVYKDKSKPYLDLYQIKTGEVFKAKVTVPTVFMQAPFKKGNILTIEEFKRRPKSKMIDGKWVKSETEFDNILESYEVY